MKKHPEFREQINASKYLDPMGSETLLAVVHRWNDPFGASAMYQHMKRHQSRDLIRAEKAAVAAATPFAVIEAPVDGQSQHDMGLDEVITLGRRSVASGQIKITGSLLLQAIKIKADIEKSTKDRRLDAVKMMKGAFSGSSPQEADKK